MKKLAINLIVLAIIGFVLYSFISGIIGGATSRISDMLDLSKPSYSELR